MSKKSREESYLPRPDFAPFSLACNFLHAYCTDPVSAVLLLQPMLRSVQEGLLLLPQAKGDHFVSALCDTLVTSPRAVSPGQPAGAVQWLIEQQAAGSEGYHTVSGRSGYQAHAAPNDGWITA